LKKSTTTTKARPKQSIESTSENLTKATSEGDGFYSCGWTWPAIHWFNYSDVLKVFNSIKVSRIKGLLITNTGIFGFNGHGNELDISEYDKAYESRLEIIADSETALQHAAELIESLQAVDET